MSKGLGDYRSDSVAELPDETLDPRLHEIVKATIHGPCGTLNLNFTYMADGDKRISQEI